MFVVVDCKRKVEDKIHSWRNQSPLVWGGGVRRWRMHLEGEIKKSKGENGELKRYKAIKRWRP